jgi:DNA-binding PadR family transcriptional regulator
MGQTNGFGGRSVNVRILRELAKFGDQPVTASELASRLSTLPRSIAPALQGLVKAGLAQRHWGDSRSPRMYAATDAGREYVARVGDERAADRSAEYA